MSRLRRVSRSFPHPLAILLVAILVITPALAQVCPAADARALFQASREWLDRQSLREPLDARAPDFSGNPKLAPEFSATAAGVVLRLNGRPVGQAWASSNSDGAACLGRALLKALQQANADRILAALPEAERAEAPQKISLEIELVGEARPLIGDRVDALAARIDNGRQAMAIRAGDRWAFSLPSMQQSLNQTQLPWYTMVAMAREVGVEAGADKKFQLPEGVVVYRADTRRLAQIAAKAPPFEVTRGMLTVPLSDINAASLDRMAIAIAAHLGGRIRPSDGLTPETIDMLQALGPAGEYQPALGCATQQVCSPLEQAMAAYAMARFAELPFSESDRIAARAFAISTLHALQRVVGEERNPLDHPAAAAACALTIQSLNRTGAAWQDPPTQEWSKLFKTKVAEHFRKSERADLQTWALCAAAFAEEAPDEVAAELDKAWQVRPVEQLLAASPWLLLAEQRVGKASDHVKAKEAWELLQPLLVRNQLSRKLDPDLAADLDGGWATTATGAAVATAQSSRPALTLALAMNPSLFGSSAAANDSSLDSLRRALRFLKQLQVDQASCYAFRDPEKSIGGIRAAPWDSNQPLGANATTLLTLLEARGLLAEDSAAKNN
ncbi:MAG: hypothetical protein K8R92_11555 [Planctomycetes bacterium]|nr:hypothetical protein [Planctomycetota bacterium]